MGWLDSGRLFRGVTPQERLLRAGVRTDVAMAVGRMAGDRRSDPTVLVVESCLAAGETVLKIMEGRLGRVMGLLVLTDQRLLFVGHGYTGPSAEIPLRSVQTVSSTGSVRTGTCVVVTATGAQLSVDRGLALSGTQFADAVRDARFGVVEATSRDPLDVIKELRALRDSGQLSEQQFQTQKRRLLDEL